MSASITYKLDLDLAFSRIKDDFSDKLFIRHPYEFQLIELDSVSWFNDILLDISKNEYKNGDLFICNIPKGKGAIRPGGHLSFNDRLVYTALVGSCYPEIQAALEWSQGKLDFSYMLRKNPSRIDWLENRFIGWKEFRKKSLDLINNQFNFLVVADIAGYYENIDLFTLRSDLKQLNINNDLVKFLMESLFRWSRQQVKGRSLPQGLSSSDILAKLYLNNIDLSLHNINITHLRYVDDIRLFSSTENEAKANLMFLIEQLRQRGLQIQTAKLQILNKNDAIAYIEGIVPVIKNVRKDLIEELRDSYSFTNSYFSISDIDEFLKEHDETIENTIIRDAYEKEIKNKDSEKFDKSLFHFLLNRLKSNKDKFAVDHAISLLKVRPEETRYILKYIKDIGALASVEPEVVSFLVSQDSVYDYQIYEILEVFDNADISLSDKFLSIIRIKLFNEKIPVYLRTICRKILSTRGSLDDIHRIQYSYSTTSDELEKCEIVYSMRRLEKEKRNSFLSQISQDSNLTNRAVRLVKVIAN